mmetsp:Transcript_24534/g.27206  ORF Transcript_24534/g.27206 Transcript_24534/m.27206 type:complete len:212 (-) Transcript_24534:415-1050(-)
MFRVDAHSSAASGRQLYVGQSWICAEQSAESWSSCCRRQLITPTKSRERVAPPHKARASRRQLRRPRPCFTPRPCSISSHSDSFSCGPATSTGPSSCPLLGPPFPWLSPRARPCASCSARSSRSSWSRWAWRSYPRSASDSCTRPAVSGTWASSADSALKISPLVASSSSTGPCSSPPSASSSSIICLNSPANSSMRAIASESKTSSPSCM